MNFLSCHLIKHCICFQDFLFEDESISLREKRETEIVDSSGDDEPSEKEDSSVTTLPSEEFG